MKRNASVVMLASAALIVIALALACGQEEKISGPSEVKTPVVAATSAPTSLPAPTNTPVPPTDTPVPPPPPPPAPTLPPPPPPPPEQPRCHPSYEGACLDPNCSDYDCAGGSGNGPCYTGTVRVVGPDVYDLDRDRDGIGCE